MTENKPVALTFSKVESLREHMLLTGVQMAKLFSVSRVTYYAWVKTDKPRLRKTNDERVRNMLRRLLEIMRDGWPKDEVKGMNSTMRFKSLLAILAEGA